MERHENEILTDNTKIHYCSQCRDCSYWGNGDAFSNRYDKSCCDIDPYPGIKPDAVIHNTGTCEYKLPRAK